VPEDHPYNTLKVRLLETHTQEKMDFLFRAIGLQEAISILANMMAWTCPSCSNTCSCSVCLSPCVPSWENRSLVTSEAWQPGRHAVGHSQATVSRSVRSSRRLRLQLSGKRSLNRRRSLLERGLEGSRWPAAVVRWHLVLVLPLVLLALLILSRCELATESVSTTG
jgi:hypothetical protein